MFVSSGYSIDDRTSELLARGCNGFIQEPFDITALSKKPGDILQIEDNNGDE